MRKNIKIGIIFIIIAIILIASIGYIIWGRNNEINTPPQESLMHYPYEEITLVLSKDWKISDTKPQALMFQRDINETNEPSIIDDLMIYTYKSLPIHDLEIMTNSYALYMKTTGNEILNTKLCDQEVNLGTSYWIKCKKKDVITETFFIKKNNIIYSISSNYSNVSEESNKEINYDLYQIVNLIY